MVLFLSSLWEVAMRVYLDVGNADRSKITNAITAHFDHAVDRLEKPEQQLTVVALIHQIRNTQPDVVILDLAKRLGQAINLFIGILENKKVPLIVIWGDPRLIPPSFQKDVIILGDLHPDTVKRILRVKVVPSSITYTV